MSFQSSYQPSLQLRPPTPPKEINKKSIMFTNRSPNIFASESQLRARLEELTRENELLRKQIRQFQEIWESVQYLIKQTDSSLQNIRMALESFDTERGRAENDWWEFWNSIKYDEYINKI